MVVSDGRDEYEISRDDRQRTKRNFQRESIIINNTHTADAGELFLTKAGLNVIKGATIMELPCEKIVSAMDVAKSCFISPFFKIKDCLFEINKSKK